MTRNAVAIVSARIWSAVTTVIVLAIVARTRSADDLGAIALGLTVGLALAVLPDAGLSSLFIREAARNPQRAPSQLGAVLATRAVTLPAFTLLAWSVVSVGFPAYALTIVVVALNPAIQQIGELARAALIARDRMWVAAAHSIIENSFWLLAVAAALATGADVTTSFGVGALALAVVGSIGFVVVQRLVSIWPARPTRPELLRLLHDGVPFATFATLAVVAARLDTIIIGLVLPSGVVAAGAYYAAARLVAAGEYLPDAVARSIYPELSRRFVADPGRMRELLAPNARSLVAVGVAIPFGLALVGDFIVDLLYGPALRPYAWILVALGGILPFKYAAMLFGTVLTSSDAQGRRAFAMAIAVVITVLVNLALLPRIGVAAAVLAGYAEWIFIASFYTLDVARRFGPVFSARQVAQSLVVAAVAFAAGLLVRMTGLPFSVVAAGAVFAFLVAVPLVGPSIRTRVRGHERGDGDHDSSPYRSP